MTTILAIFGVWCWISFSIGGAMLARADYLDGILSGPRALFYALACALFPPLWTLALIWAGWDSWREARECEELQ